MTDTTNDIDALASFLERVGEGDFMRCDPEYAGPWSKALTALLAERDALKAQVNAGFAERLYSHAQDLAAAMHQRDEATEIAKHIVLSAFTWSVFHDGSVGADLRGGCKHLTDLNLDAETEIFVRRTIRDHIAYKIAEAGARRDADLIEAERARNERRAQGGGA